MHGFVEDEYSLMTHVHAHRFWFLQKTPQGACAVTHIFEPLVSKVTRMEAVIDAVMVLARVKDEAAGYRSTVEGMVLAVGEVV